MGTSSPRAVRTWAAALAVGGLLAAGVPVASATPAPASASVRAVVGAVDGSADQDALEAEVLRLTNKARAKARKCGGKRMKAVRPVRWSAVLASSANQHSADMATNDYFAHNSPSAGSPFDRIRASGYVYRAAGENIAAGRSLDNPAAVVRAWLKSPGHCRIIMSGKFKELGVGRVEGPGKWGVYWTQNFATQR
jgi:uncharacterized protein YkwD